MPAAKQARRSVRTKTPHQLDKMLDAAGKLFGSQRFHEVRMEDIATEAAVGKGTLYRYFSDKEELYLMLLERSSRQFMERLRQQKAQAVGPQAQLHALVAAVITFFDEQPHLFDLIQRAEVLREPNRSSPWQETRDELLRLLRELLHEGKRQAQFTICDPDLVALLLLGGLRSVIRFGGQPRPPDLARRIVEAFLRSDE
jgi:AcrR family transcriptional regulator